MRKSGDKGRDNGRDSTLELEIRQLCEQAQWETAAGRIIEGYAPEIRRFMFGELFQPSSVDDAFGNFSMSVLQGIRHFRWECALRTWLYILARNACHQLRNGAGRREQLMNTSEFPEPVYRPRTETEPWRRTEVKERFWGRVRESFNTDELTLVNLRIQKHAWKDIARIMEGSTGPLSEEDVERRAGALRQQFQRLKGRLRDLAIEEGLLPPEPPLDSRST